MENRGVFVDEINLGGRVACSGGAARSGRSELQRSGGRGGAGDCTGDAGGYFGAADFWLETAGAIFLFADEIELSLLAGEWHVAFDCIWCALGAVGGDGVPFGRIAGGSFVGDGSAGDWSGVLFRIFVRPGERARFVAEFNIFLAFAGGGGGDRFGDAAGGGDDCGRGCVD